MAVVGVAYNCNADMFEYVCEQLMCCNDTHTARLGGTHTAISREDTATEKVITIHASQLLADLSIPAG